MLVISSTCGKDRMRYTRSAGGFMQGLDQFFKISERGSSVSTEVIDGNKCDRAR